MIQNLLKCYCLLLALTLAHRADAALTATNLWPANGATNVCTDTPLRISFNTAPTLNNTGKIRIYTTAGTLIDTVDLTLNVTNAVSTSGSTSYAINVQSRTIAGTSYTSFPVIISGNTAFIYPHLDLLTTNQAYYINVDAGIFSAGTNGSYAGISDATTWRFTTKPALPAASITNLVVAADGSGDFCTVQGVVDYLPSKNTVPRQINLRNGLYQEIIQIKQKYNLTFRGQDRKQTLIAYANNNNMNASSSTRIMLYLNSVSNIVFENLTISNSTPKGGSQAEAVRLGGTACIFNNIDLCSYQDTLLVNSSGDTAYVYNSLVQGDTDFIWGIGTVMFQDCEIRALNAGYNCQMRTLSTTYGAVFVDCILTKAYSFTGHFLDRMLNSSSSPSTTAHVAYINCKMDNHIDPEGWLNASTNSAASVRFWEYQSMDLTGTNLIDISQRTNFSSQITATVAAQMRNPAIVFGTVSSGGGGWVPKLAPNIIRQPTNQTAVIGQTAVFAVGATGIPDPTYQWRFNGTNIAGATNAMFSIPGVQATNAAAYSVIVSNSSSFVVSSNALLTVNTSAPPVLGSAGWNNGRFAFTFSGGAGSNYAVQTSSNLTQWQTVFSTNSPALPFDWTDTNASAYPAQYYRVQVN